MTLVPSRRSSPIRYLHSSPDSKYVLYAMFGDRQCSLTAFNGASSTFHSWTGQTGVGLAEQDVGIYGHD